MQAVSDALLPHSAIFNEIFMAVPGNSVLLAADSPRFTILAVTDDFVKTSGISREQLLGKEYFKAFPENPRDPNPTGINNLLSSFTLVIEDKREQRMTAQRYDIKDRHGDYTEEYWTAINKPILNQDGSVYGILHTATNITAEVLKGKIEARAKSMEQVNNIFMQTPIAIAILKGPEFVIELANKPLIEVWGKGPNVLGKPILQVLPEIKDQGFIELMQQVVRDDKPFYAYEMPVELLRNNVRETVYFNFIYQPYREGTHQAPQGIIIFASEVTDQVSTRKELALKEQSLGLAIEIGELGVFRIDLPEEDLENCPATFSSRIAEWFELGTQVTAMRQVADKVYREDQEKVLKMLVNTIAGENHGKHDITYRIVSSQNKLRYLRSVGQVQYEQNKAKFISGIIQDVTEQRLIQEKTEREVLLRTKELADVNNALKQSNIDLLRSNQNLEEFAHAASHDLKEPIRKILIFTSQLREQIGTQLNSSQLWSFERILSATQRMGSLIDDLLIYSYLNERSFERDNIDLNKLLKQVLEDLELNIEDKSATINAGNLPHINGFKRQIQQMFQNLIGNSLKYGKENVPPLINITAQRETVDGREYNVLNFEDNGIGFDLQYADKIFQMFSRLHRNDAYAGTGLGLSIVKKVAENHNGFIKVHSEEGKGSTFSVYLAAV